jgi:hypothetical protein
MTQTNMKNQGAVQQFDGSRRAQSTNMFICARALRWTLEALRSSASSCWRRAVFRLLRTTRHGVDAAGNGSGPRGGAWLCCCCRSCLRCSFARARARARGDSTSSNEAAPWWDPRVVARVVARLDECE